MGAVRRRRGLRASGEVDANLCTGTAGTPLQTKIMCAGLAHSVESLLERGFLCDRAG